MNKLQVKNKQKLLGFLAHLEKINSIKTRTVRPKWESAKAVVQSVVVTVELE